MTDADDRAPHIEEDLQPAYLAILDAVARPDFSVNHVLTARAVVTGELIGMVARDEAEICAALDKIQSRIAAVAATRRRDMIRQRLVDAGLILPDSGVVN